MPDTYGGVILTQEEGIVLSNYYYDKILALNEEIHNLKTRSDLGKFYGASGVECRWGQLTARKESYKARRKYIDENVVLKNTTTLAI